MWLIGTCDQTELTPSVSFFFAVMPQTDLFLVRQRLLVEIPAAHVDDPLLEPATHPGEVLRIRLLIRPLEHRNQVRGRPDEVVPDVKDLRDPGSEDLAGPAQ